MRAEGHQCSRIPLGGWDHGGLSGDPGHLWGKLSSWGRVLPSAIPMHLGAARLSLGRKSGTSPRGWVEVLLLCVALGAGLSLECAGEMDSSRGLPSPHTDLQTRGGGGQASSRSCLCAFVSSSLPEVGPLGSCLRTRPQATSSPEYLGPVRVTLSSPDPQSSQSSLLQAKGLGWG